MLTPEVLFKPLGYPTPTRGDLVGQVGIEPTTSSLSGMRSHQLSYCPERTWEERWIQSQILSLLMTEDSIIPLLALSRTTPPVVS